MEFHKTGRILFCATDPRDLDYIQAVSECVYRECPGDRDRWHFTPDKLWKVFVGVRSGVFGVRLGGRVSCVKLYCDSRLHARLRVLAGCAKAKRAYHNAVRLGQLGVHCPAALGYAELRPSGPGLVVTELIEGGMRLDHWIPEHGIRREAVVALAGFLRNMHARGAAHVDLSPRNILIRAGAGGFEFFLLDYEDVRWARNVSRRQRLDNLNHLHERTVRLVPLRARLRFLREYAGREYDAWRDDLGRMIRRSRSKHVQGLWEH